MHSEISTAKDTTPPQNLAQIPSNVLEKLFIHLVTNDNSYDPSRFYIRYKTISILRLVSRYWSQVIVSSPRLWQRVAIDVSSLSSRYPPVNVVKLWIDRTYGIQNLEILISMPSQPSFVRQAHAQAIMNVLRPAMDRWEEFWFSSEAGVQDFPRDLSKARILTKLSISAGIIDKDAIEIIGPTLHSLPGAIRDLDLDILDFDGLFILGKCYPMRLEHLERLTLYYEGWIQGIINILSDVRGSLISVDIHADGQWSCSTQYHSLASHTPTFSFTAIRYLKLWISDANVDLFEYLEMGSLEVIDLSVNWTTILERARKIAPLVNFIINRSASLQTCTMRFNRSPYDWASMAFYSPEVMRLRTYVFYNVESETVLKYAVAGSPHVFTRIRLIPQNKPSRYTIGWDENND